MRDNGEIRAALLKACRELVTADKAPTLRELAERACVGMDAAKRTVQNMRRSGDLRIVRERQVDYRNRAVAEWVPGRKHVNDDQFSPSVNSAPLQTAMRAWG